MHHTLKKTLATILGAFLVLWIGLFVLKTIGVMLLGMFMLAMLAIKGALFLGVAYLLYKGYRRLTVDKASL